MPRPANVSRPALSLAAVALALFGVARTTGSGWLIVILTGIAAVVALASLLPPFGLRRVRVEVEAPREGTVGRTAELTIDVDGGGSARPVKLILLGFEGPWTGVMTPARGRLPLVPLRRGVYTSVQLDVRSAAPLGLMWWKRRILVDLTRPFEVGPMPVGMRLDAPRGSEDSGTDDGRVASSLADAVKTVREYVAGDAIKLVHWPATARAGELMVKELEAPVAPVLCIAVDLRNGTEAAVEEAASRAAGLALAAIAAGVPVTLLTAEAAGPRSGPVVSPGDVNRRLARAVAGALPPAPRGTDPIVVSP
ncbi:MAG TPA: DUF58 domain-containing protein [Acidimicrobiales bacterium]|nr:DUF58 domain-containing protein [Acidimicrobiales bacterium]